MVHLIDFDIRGLIINFGATKAISQIKTSGIISKLLAVICSCYANDEMSEGTFWVDFDFLA